jgi:hypothetical protein
MTELTFRDMLSESKKKLRKKGKGKMKAKILKRKKVTYKTLKPKTAKALTNSKRGRR